MTGGATGENAKLLSSRSRLLFPLAGLAAAAALQPPASVANETRIGEFQSSGLLFKDTVVSTCCAAVGRSE